MKCPKCNIDNNAGAVLCKICGTKIVSLLRIPSSSSTKGYKLRILKMLSDNLKVFIPEYSEHFLCPTCLEAIPLKRKGEITEAHIIPKSAGGTIKTYLCDRCNHLFGTNQDKWFGEFLKTVDPGIPRYIPTDIKEGIFWIDDTKVNGAWQEDKNGNLVFYIHKNRNAPFTNKLIEDKFKKRPPNLKIGVKLPILQKRRLVEVGFLTAGYLMWFRALGYS